MGVDEYKSLESYRVIRGGGWSSNAWSLRSANRLNRYPGKEYSFVGFRLVRTLVILYYFYPLTLGELVEPCCEAHLLDRLKKPKPMVASKDKVHKFREFKGDLL